MRVLGRVLLAALALLLAPLFLLATALTLLATDAAWALFGRRRPAADVRADHRAASVVIPNWNGRDLLEKYLPSVIAACASNPDNEIIVVDNASTDGSAEYVRTTFPQVRVLALPRNEGFGGGSNAGVLAARNDVAVLLNSDMRVAPDFLAPLLAAFDDQRVFAVSCQIFFSDPGKRREETGLTQGWWHRARLRLRHREDPAIDRAFPCFYGGGGSSAFDRRKFLELGGFDPVLAPFYLEDADLGYMAWKRGWKVLYEPRSVVWHEHRGTIGKRFSRAYIDSVVKKNFLLFTWKNMHSWRRVAPHLLLAILDAPVSALAGDSPERSNALAWLRAVRQLPGAARARWRARSLALIDDTEALRRPMGGYYRDRFAPMERDPDRLSVLFVSPYPIAPPTHGGAVFMHGTVSELARRCDLHLLVMLDRPDQRAAHDRLAAECRSAEFVVRRGGLRRRFASVEPHAVTEFRDEDFEWLLHRQMLLHAVDVVQLEYTPMAQYAGAWRRTGCILFEHDIYFQSIARQLRGMSGMQRVKAEYEYLRAFRWELKALPAVDRVQVCSAENRAAVAGFAPRVIYDDDLRAGILVRDYPFTADGREPDTMLFLGSFRHAPNKEALLWFAGEVLPRIRARRPAARLIIVGSEAPPAHLLPQGDAVEVQGFVADVREPLGRCAVFVCPILSGSGMRVKLLEAFASGIPVVSTKVGAEGLAGVDGDICRLADSAEAFAAAVVALLDDEAQAQRLAAAARARMEQERDLSVLTARLEQRYRELVRAKRREQEPR